MSDDSRIAAATSIRDHAARDALRRFATWCWISLAGVVLAVVGVSVQLWLLRGYWTFGSPIVTRVPISMINSSGGSLLSSGYLLAGVSFVVAMAYARKVAESSGLRGFRWGLGWTIGSFFIPILNFYRPWVWFAEIRRAAFDSAALATAGAAWAAKRSFSAATFALASLYFCIHMVGLARGYVILTSMLDALRVGSLKQPKSFLTFVSDNFGLLVGQEILEIVLLLALAIYLATLQPKLKRVASLNYGPIFD